MANDLVDAAAGVSVETVEKAVNALLKWRDSETLTQKPQLLEKDEFLYLILSLKKIPQNPRVNPHKLPLPNPLLDPSTDPAELCLIIDDRPKSGLTKDAASKKIKSENIPISKVIKLSKLKTDYKAFESKRKLCDCYEMFFADKRIIPLLPRLLGKQFFKKKKIPVAVDLKHKNWKEQIQKACSSAMLFLSTGTCCVVKVGKVSMGRKEMVENVFAAINGIAETVPSKWGNIRAFHLKLLDSVALPLYQTVPDLRLKIVAGNEEVLEEKTDQMDATPQTKKRKSKGRIHEVQYMDESSNGRRKNEIETNDVVKIMAKNGEQEEKQEEIDTPLNKKKTKGRVQELDEHSKGEMALKRKKKSELRKLRGVDVKVSDKKKKKTSAA